MKAVILAIVAFGTLVSVLARSSTGATFTDRVTSSGNTFTTATMAPPTGLSASLGADGETVTLNWTATTTAFATSYDVSRGTVSPTYAFLTNVSPASTVTTTDLPVKPVTSASYYYALQSRYQNWASTYSTEASVKPLDHFAVTNTSGGSIVNQTAGTAFNVRVAAQTFDNLAITNFTGTVALAGSSGSGCTATPASQALVGGAATYSVTCTTAVTGVSLTATYSPALPLTSRTGTSNTFDVVAAVTSGQLLMENAADLKRSADPASSFLVGNGGTITLRSGPAATSSGSVAFASNASNWTLNIVLTTNEPNAANLNVAVTVWWQGGNSCSGTPPVGQIFAQGSVPVAKPGATDSVGRQLSVPAIGGSVSHTFAANDVLCLRIDNSGNSQDSFHIKTNVVSTAGVVGITSGLAGPMAFTP